MAATTTDGGEVASLMSLSDELLLKIFMGAIRRPNDATRLSLVCRDAHRILLDRDIWARFLLKHLGVPRNSWHVSDPNDGFELKTRFLSIMHDVHGTGGDSYKGLVVACDHGCERMAFKIRAKQGNDPLRPLGARSSPCYPYQIDSECYLAKAAASGHAHMVDFCLSNQGLGVEGHLSSGDKTPLHHAIEGHPIHGMGAGHVACAAKLLDFGHPAWNVYGRRRPSLVLVAMHRHLEDTGCQHRHEILAMLMAYDPPRDWPGSPIRLRDARSEALGTLVADGLGETFDACLAVVATVSGQSRLTKVTIRRLIRAARQVADNGRCLAALETHLAHRSAAVRALFGRPSATQRQPPKHSTQP